MKFTRLVRLYRSQIQLRPNPAKKIFSKNYTTHRLYYLFFLKNGTSPASFSFIFVFSSKHYNFTTSKCEKMSIQMYVVQ